MAEVVKEFQMKVPAEKLAETVLDFENYPEFVDEVVAARTVSRPGEKLAVEFDLNVIKRFRYVLAFDVDPPGLGARRIAWRLLESDLFKENRGEWLIEPAGSAAAKVRYTVEIAAKVPLPGWVLRKLTETNLPKMMENFEAAARER
jgi:ribosome-associated toxin RatA of RatAB toxin-antitoxin module